MPTLKYPTNRLQPKREKSIVIIKLYANVALGDWSQGRGALCQGGVRYVRALMKGSTWGQLEGAMACNMLQTITSLPWNMALCLLKCIFTQNLFDIIHRPVWLSYILVVYLIHLQISKNTMDSMGLKERTMNFLLVSGTTKALKNWGIIATCKL